MNTLHLFRDDFTADQTWDLLAWCVDRGANEFTGAPIGLGAAPSTIMHRLKRFHSGDTQRSLFGGKPESAPVWELTAESLSLLKSLLDDGLFTYGVGAEEWLEDPILFRNQEFFLGIVTHEAEGIIRVTPEEQNELHSIGIRFRDRGQWVGYTEGTTTARTVPLPRGGSTSG